MDQGIWQDGCPIHTPGREPAPSPTYNTIAYHQDDDSATFRMLPIALIAMLSILVLTVFFFVKFRRSWLGNMGGPVIMPRVVLRIDVMSDVQTTAAGVDLQALESSHPACRPMVLGASQSCKLRDLEEAEVRSEISRESEAACAVCLGHLQQGEEVRRLPCEHLFHRQCIDSWLGKSLQCPVCRQVVGRADASRLPHDARSPRTSEQQTPHPDDPSDEYHA